MMPDGAVTLQLRSNKLTRAMQKTERHRAVVMIVNLIPLGYSCSSSNFSRAFASSTGVFSTVSSPRCCEALLPIEGFRETGTWPFCVLADRFLSTVSSPRCRGSLLPIEVLRATGTWPFFSLSDRFFSLSNNEEPLLESWLVCAALGSYISDGEAAFDVEKTGNFMLSTKSREIRLLIRLDRESTGSQANIKRVCEK